MIEEYKESMDDNTVKDLDTLKKDIVVDSYETDPNNEDPTYEEWENMFDRGNIFKVYGNTVFMGKEKEWPWWSRKSFIEALCKYTASICKYIPANRDKSFGWEILEYDQIRKMKEGDPSNKISKEDLDVKLTTFNDRIKNLDVPENLEYFAKIVAWTIPKDGTYWSFQITTEKGKPPTLRIYEANIFQDSISERFNIQLWNPELLEKLLTKVFSYIDTTTNKADGEWNYMKALFQ